MNRYTTSAGQSSHKKGIAGPQADKDFKAIAAPEIRRRVLLAHLVYGIKQISRHLIGKPIARVTLWLWRQQGPGARFIERLGLPRTGIEQAYGKKALILHINPRDLKQFAMHPRGVKRKPSSEAFIWDGDWDLCRVELQNDYALKFIRDLATHRDDLSKTKKYQELIELAEAGTPFRSHQEGLYLNSRERILQYLSVYLGFLDQMDAQGYQAKRAKDYPGVAITREGRIVKVRRGAHRLAMAQWLGIKSLPVQVHYIHRQWWNRQRKHLDNATALRTVLAKLPHLSFETELGELSPSPAPEHEKVHFACHAQPDLYFRVNSRH